MPDPIKKITYKVGNDKFDIDPSQKDEFLKDFPNAQELLSFKVDKDTFDIEPSQRDEFLRDFPNAVPTFAESEKKNPIGSSSPSGSQGLQGGTPSAQKPIPSKPLVGLGGGQENQITQNAITEALYNAPRKRAEDIAQGKYVINGTPVSKFQYREKAYDRKFVSDVAEGKQSVETSDPEAKALIESQVKTFAGNDQLDALRAGFVNLLKGGVGAVDYANDVMEQITGKEDWLYQFWEAQKGYRGLPKSDPRSQTQQQFEEAARNGEKAIETLAYAFKKGQEREQEKIFKVREDFVDLASKGQFKEMGIMALNTTLESAPLSAVAAAATYATGGMAGTVGVLFPVTTGMQHAETLTTDDEKIKALSEQDKLLRSGLYGGFEAGGEAFTGGLANRTWTLTKGAVQNMAKSILARSGEDAAKDFLEGAAKETTRKIVKNWGLETLGEGTSEALTGLGQRITDNYFGVTDDSITQILRGTVNDFALGAASGALMSSPAAAAQTAQLILDRKLRQGDDAKKELVEGAAIYAQKSGIPEEDIVANIESRSKAVNSVPEKLVEDTETIDLVQEKQSLETEKKDLDPVFQKPIEEKIAKIEKELQDRLQRRQSVLEKREADGIEAEVLGEIPSFVQAAVTRIEDDKPTSPSQIDRASSWLYGEYKKIKELKGNPDSPISQKKVNILLENLSADIEMLENAKNVLQERAYIEPEIVTSPTKEEYATVNRNDGKGTVTLTKSEYEAEVIGEKPQTAPPKTEATPTKEQVAPVAETTPPQETPVSESETNKIPAKEGTLAASFDNSEDISKYVEGGSEVTVGDTKMTLIEKGNNVVELNKIKTPKPKRGKGSARKALHELTAKADEQGITLELNVAPEKGTTKEGLVKLYESQGFVADKGDMMRREPNKIETPKTETNAQEQQSEPLRSESQQEQPQGKSYSDLPKVNRTELQDRKTPKEEITKKQERIQELFKLHEQQIYDIEFDKAAETKAEIEKLLSEIPEDTGTDWSNIDEEARAEQESIELAKYEAERKKNTFGLIREKFTPISISDYEKNGGGAGSYLENKRFLKGLVVPDSPNVRPIDTRPMYDKEMGGKELDNFNPQDIMDFINAEATKRAMGEKTVPERTQKRKPSTKREKTAISLRQAADKLRDSMKGGQDMITADPFGLRPIILSAIERTASLMESGADLLESEQLDRIVEFVKNNPRFKALKANIRKVITPDILYMVSSTVYAGEQNPVKRYYEQKLKDVQKRASELSSQKIKDLRKSLNEKFSEYKKELKEKTRSDKAIVSDAKKQMQAAVRDSKIPFSNTQAAKIGRLISDVTPENISDKGTELSEYLGKLVEEQREREQKAAEKKAENEQKTKEKQQAAIEKTKDEYATKGYRIGEAFGKLAGEIRGKAVGRKEGQKIGEAIGKQKLQSFKERQKQFASDVKKALDTDLGDSISANQFKQIINAALKVNVDNENSINRFIDRVEKIIEDSQYYDRMDAMRKKQKALRKRKHPQFQSVVNDFASIDPEMIPSDMWNDYSSAIEDASKSIPNYQKLIDMYYQVMQLKPKESESFPNYQILENKAEEIWDFLSDQKMRSISDYRKITKTISKFKKEARRLLGEESITQDQYDDLMEELGIGIDSVEKRFSSEIYSLKTDLIQFIFDREKSYSLTNVDLVEKDLLKKINSLDNDQLRSLSIDELIDLSDIMEMVGESGYVDIFHLSPILAKAQSANVGSEIKKQADKYGGVTDVQESLRKASLSDYNQSEAALGLGTNKYGAVYQHVLQPINKAASDMAKFVKDGIFFMGTLKKKHGIKKTEQTDRIGMFATYLREYGLGFDPKLKGTIDEDVNQEYGKRDWFKHIIEKYPAYLGKKKNKIALALYGAGKMDAITSAYNYMLERSGEKTLDPVDIYRSFTDNDGKYLPKNEVEYLKELLDWKERMTRPLQEAANAMRGLPFYVIMFHVHRMRQGGTDRTIPKPEDVNVSKKGAISLSSNTGKEVLSNKIGPIEFNMDRIITAENAMIAKDYYMTPALMRVNSAIKSARDAMGGTNATTETMSNIVQEMLRNEFTKVETGIIDNISNNIRSARSIKVFLSPARTAFELGASLIEYPLRADVGYIRLASNIIGKDKRALVRSLMLDTESTLLNRESIRKDFEIEAGEVTKKGLLSEKSEAMASLPERTMLIPIWLGVFQNKFKEITGTKFDENKYRTSEAYRRRFRKETNDSAAFADGAYEDIAGTTSRAGQRRDTRVLPFVKKTQKVSSTIGKEITYLSGYNTRQTGRLYRSIPVIREAAMDIDMSQKKLSVPFAKNVYNTVGKATIKEVLAAVGMLGSSVFYGTMRNLWFLAPLYLAQYIKGDEGDEEEKEALLSRMRDSLTKEGISEELLAALASINLTRYGSVGRAAGYIAGSLAYSMSDDKQLKESIKKYIRNITYKDPVDFEKMMQKGQYYEMFAQVLPSLATLVELTYSEVKAYGGINKLKEKIANGEDIDEKDRAILALVRMTSTTINMFGAFFGMYIPTGIFEDMSKSMPVRTIDEVIEEEIRKTPEAIASSQRAKDDNAIHSISEDAIKQTYKETGGKTIPSEEDIPSSSIKYIEGKMTEQGLTFKDEKSRDAKLRSFMHRYNENVLKRKDFRYMQIDPSASGKEKAAQIARAFGEDYLKDESIQDNLKLMGVNTSSKIELENGAKTIMSTQIENNIEENKQK